jgi:hypothetical protein
MNKIDSDSEIRSNNKEKYITYIHTPRAHYKTSAFSTFVIDFFFFFFWDIKRFIILNTDTDFFVSGPTRIQNSWVFEIKYNNIQASNF